MKGIDLSTKNNQGVTALEIAVLQNRPGIETLLRSAGAK
jgi:ankyrin repeat protein